MLKLLLLCFLSLAIAKIYVQSPESLKTEMEIRNSNGEIKSSLAHFGNPPYGSVIAGRVFYRAYQSDACQQMDPFNWTDGTGQVNNPILLVNRGICPFSIKARHAEDVGAKALIVVDDIMDEDPGQVTMIYSDNSGRISIPTLLISKLDGEIIKRYINNINYTNQVALSLKFDVPQSGNKISIDLYMSSEIPQMDIFLKDFAAVASEIKKTEAFFWANYVTKECVWCSILFFSVTDEDCVSGGRYCCDPPACSSLKGRDYVYEDLREKCIYKETEKEDSYALFFNYFKYYSDLCQGHINRTCVEAAMNKANINADKISLCMKQSFVGKDELLDDNTLLRSEKELTQRIPSTVFPYLIVNGQHYRGEWETETVLKFLCAGYSDGQAAEFCQGRLLDKENKDQEDKEEKAKEDKAKEDKAKEEKAKEDKAKEDKAKEDKAKEDKAKEDKAKEDKAKEDKAKEDKAKEDKTKNSENKSVGAGSIVLILTPCVVLIALIFILYRVSPWIKRKLKGEMGKQTDIADLEDYKFSDSPRKNDGEMPKVRV